MPAHEGPRAVLLTGPYGVGKSSVAAEIAGLLEGQLPYAAIDLDWLSWFDDGGDGAHSRAGTAMLARNLAAVVGNYREAGITMFVLAGSVLDAEDCEVLRRALDMPTTVVRLEATIAEIEARLAPDVTTGRQEDLRVSREWIASGQGTGFEDHVVANRGPIREVARAVLELMSDPIGA